MADDWQMVSPPADSGPDLRGNAFHVILIGPAGEGRSSLANAITFKQKCGQINLQSTEAVEALTEVRVAVPVGDVDDFRYVSVVVYDSSGFTGSEDEDDMVTAELRKVPNPDLILVCFSFVSNSGRFMPMVHGSVMEKVREVWGFEAMKRVVVVLTNSDLASAEYERQEAGRDGHTAESRARGAERFWDDMDVWKKQLQVNQRRKIGHDIPVCATGLLEFSEPGAGGIPSHVTAVGGRKDWHENLWRTVGGEVSEGLGDVFLALLQQVKLQYEHFRNDLEGSGDNADVTRTIKKAAVGVATGAVVAIGAISLAPSTIGTSVAVGALALAVGFAGKACVKTGMFNALTSSDSKTSTDDNSV